MESPSRRVSMLDLDALHAPLHHEIMGALERVARSQRFIHGPEVAEFEQAAARYLGVPHAIGCASGSAALLLPLLAEGIGPGDEVIVPAFTFFATAGSVVHAGARPVFADIDPRTFNLDPNALEDLARRRPRVRAVIPVHLYGGSADMGPILDIAARHHWIVIEDGAQSIGAEYQGKKCLGLGHYGAISFYPAKNLGAFGDAGMVVTADAERASRLTALRVHGEVRKYFHQWVGLNARLDTLQAAVLKVKLPYLDGWTQARQNNARAYRERLRGLPVTLPEDALYQTRHVANQFVIRAPRRDRLRERLAERGIGTEIYYPTPLHLQPCFAHLGHAAGSLPESEKAASEALALPVHPTLELAEIDYVCAEIARFYAA